MSRTQRLTASQGVLLGAADLAADGKPEFSEWDLTVAVWRRDPQRFGCRGYEAEYPDHKRVMMEIMARKKNDNPLRRGWFERTRTNHYRITSLGLAEAERLGEKDRHSSSMRSPADVYDAVVPYANHRVFKRFCKDHAEPKTWLGAEAFLGITKNDAVHVADRLRLAENVIAQALLWLDDADEDALRRTVSGSGLTLRRQDLELLSEFVGVLLDRFKVQFEAIMKAANHKPRTTV